MTDDETKKRLAGVLNLVKTGTLNKPLVFSPAPYGEALIKTLPLQHALSPATMPAARDEMQWQADRARRAINADHSAALEKLEKGEASVAETAATLGKIQDHNLARVEGHRASLKRLKKLAAYANDRATVDRYRAEIQGIEQQLGTMESAAAEVNTDIEEIIKRLDKGERLGAPVINRTDDIEIVVGYIPYSTAKGNIPIYPVIECWFPSSMPLLDKLEEFYPRRLALSTEGRRYKVYEPGREDLPLAFCDAPVDQHLHDTFQRLYKHWGNWFLRIHGPMQHWDFQVIKSKGKTDGAVYKLSSPIENTLGAIGTPSEQFIADAIQQAGPESRLNASHVKGMLALFEKLVGPLPVARIGHNFQTLPDGKLFAWVVLNDHASQWMTLDAVNVHAQVRRIVGGSGAFHSVIYESVRPDVDLVQLFSVTKDDTVRQPEVWLRARSTAPRIEIPSRGKANDAAFRAHIQQKNVRTFDKLEDDSVCSLVDDDLPTVEKFYKKPSEYAPMKPSEMVTENADATEVDKAMHESIIANFLLISQTVRTSASGGDVNSQLIWPFLRDAVIFELPPSAYLTLYDEFIRYIARVAKLDPSLSITQHTAKQRARLLGIMKTGQDAPFPEKLPFRSCFFAYGSGVVGPNPRRTELQDALGASDSVVGKLYGHLVTETGVVVGFRYLSSPNKNGLAVTFDRDPSVSTRWDGVETLSPWIINALVEYVNEHKSLIEQGKNGLGHQILVKKTAKTLNIVKPPVPPPFYVVYMKDALIRQQAQQRATSIKHHIDWQHRWKVRGHECIRFMRGQLPIVPELETELLERGYRVFTTTQPDSAAFMALSKRGVEPKRNDEWMAVLTYWREPFEKGPADRPLIESTRRSTKKWARWVDWNSVEVKQDEPEGAS